MSAPAVDLRLGRAARAYVVCFSVVWCVLAVSSLVRAARAGSAATLAIGAVLVVVGAAVGVRACRVGARSDGDRLTVRNAWRTRVLDRGEIEDVRTGRVGGRGIPLGSSVLLLLRDGTLLPVQGASSGLPLPGSRDAQTGQVEQVRAWLRAGSPHPTSAA